ncbi:rubrerythrin [Bradyrhizobium sp. LB7.1]
MKTFADLTEREVLAVAISSEEEDSRIYMTFAEDLRERYPDTAKIFEEMAEEERGHRRRLLKLYEERFGQHLPPIRREDVKGFLRRRPIWLTKNLTLDTIRKEVETMEFEAERFYARAAEQAEDVGVRRLLGDLAEEEKHHENRAAALTDEILKPDVRAEEDRTRRRTFVLQYVQPGLAGLMDGSVSTLAPLFAAAFATHQNWQTFLVGLAASIGAGISMGFAEALSDDGSLSGARLAMAARHHLRRDDDARRPRPHPALSRPRQLAERILDRDGNRRRRRVLRIVGDRLYPLTLHGHAVPPGRVPDRARRRHRAGGGRIDRSGVGSSRSVAAYQSPSNSRCSIRPNCASSLRQ